MKRATDRQFLFNLYTVDSDHCSDVIFRFVCNKHGQVAFVALALFIVPHFQEDFEVTFKELSLPRARITFEADGADPISLNQLYSLDEY
jgi:hypothetical protein